MNDLDDVFERLQHSAFRRKFRLGPREREYLDRRGLETILEHGRDFIDARLAAAEPRNDGKQTPMRGHPIFIAQHATATCCRGCLQKWHGIARGHDLSDVEKAHILGALARWLEAQSGA